MKQDILISTTTVRAMYSKQWTKPIPVQLRTSITIYPRKPSKKHQVIVWSMKVLPLLFLLRTTFQYSPQNIVQRILPKRLLNTCMNTTEERHKKERTMHEEKKQKVWTLESNLTSKVNVKILGLKKY